MNIADITDALTRFEQQDAGRLHLIASENDLPAAARAAYLSPALTRYCFGSGGQPNWAWPGREPLAALEDATCAGIGALLGASAVSVKPLSGLSAMTVALSALALPSATVFGLAQADGGHGSTEFVTRRLGLTWQPLPTWGGRIDTDVLARRVAAGAGPVLIYLDAFMALFPHDLAAIRAAVGERAVIHYDASHTLGLIAGGQFQDPLAEGADSLGGSVHKTWPGPPGKGILATNHPVLARRIDEHATGWISHSHPADLAALAVSTAWMSEHGRDYAAAVIANAATLAAGLDGAGIPVCAREAGHTASHQVWVDIDPICPAETASARLWEAGIVVNAIDIPYLRAPGLRLGVQELTFGGFDTAAMGELAALMADVLTQRTPAAAAAVRVADLRAHYLPGPGAGTAADYLARLPAADSSTVRTS
ncbi:PLP-dependent aminotransferase family protein [Nocardia puris]|uniref:Glycine hydroxymethyltransferase n=1 Tax=Nocardia puris TaxID=208602 RepID=A0A366D5I4_9NOCA|nr:hypothetical protein [Nocardia puris]RBO85290.1 glycine hydroxymethyltransferase [Nocardia puris]